MPLELSKKIQSFLKPKEGFRIEAGQTFKIKDYIIKINNAYINKGAYFIWGARIFTHKGEPDEVCGFCTSCPIFGKFEDMEYRKGNILLNKKTLII